jgi:hypothetical protein
MTPICITVLRLRRSEIDAAVKAPTTTKRIGATASQRTLLGGQMQRLLGQHKQRAAERQVVALDEADHPEHQDDLYVINAERNTVELSSKQKAG